MSLPETTDLTLAKNWTPKTLTTAVINTLTVERARAVWEILTKENVELNDLLSAEGKLKKVDFKSLVHYICTSGILKKRTEAELISILNGLYMRLNIEFDREQKQKLAKIEDEKTNGSKTIMLNDINRVNTQTSNKLRRAYRDFIVATSHVHNECGSKKVA